MRVAANFDKIKSSLNRIFTAVRSEHYPTGRVDHLYSIKIRPNEFN